MLYLDEIQYFNKKQQQSLLEFMENGKLTLIASTTENPYFSVYNAVLSRSTVFEFKPVAPEEVLPVVRRGIGQMGRSARWRSTVRKGWPSTSPAPAAGTCGRPSTLWRPSSPPMPWIWARLPSPWRRPTRWPSAPPTAMTGTATATTTFCPPFRNPSGAPTPTPPSTTWPGCWRREISSPPAAG